MTVIDLSHQFDQNTLLWPGTEPNKIIPKASVAKNGYMDHQLVLSGHTGTHIDTPAHFLDGGKLLDDYAAEDFIGQGQVIDVSNSIIEEKVNDFQDQIDFETEFVLIYTGWSNHWGKSDYYNKFSYLSENVAKQLAQLNLKGVGIDSPSSDPLDSENFPAHHLLLGAGFILIENLCNLKSLIGRKFLFSCLPLNIKGVEGSPVRAVAIL